MEKMIMGGGAIGIVTCINHANMIQCNELKSRNFTLQELIKSDTAIRLDINNNPNSGQIEKLKALCENILTAST